MMNSSLWLHSRKNLSNKCVIFIFVIFAGFIYGCKEKVDENKSTTIEKKNENEKTKQNARKTIPFSCNTKSTVFTTNKNILKINEIKKNKKRVELQVIANALIAEANISLGNKSIFVFEDTEIENAYCLVNGNENFLIINPIYSKNIANWSGNENDNIENVLVFLHEIGHIINNHNESSHSNELIADRFAGVHLCILGYSLGDLEDVSEKIFDKFGSETHPPIEKRLQAMQDGFRSTIAQVPAINRDRLQRFLDKNYPLQKIESGSFLMGSKKDNFAAPNEKPQKKIDVEDDFLIGKFEVTQEIWRKVEGTNPSLHKNCPKCPVEKVDFNDIRRFLQHLNDQSGREYRLPTEIEWEYTALYNLPEDSIVKFHNSNLNAKSWNIDNSNLNTHPVGDGKKKHNPNIDVYDMIGNVTEWCNTSFKFYEKNSKKNNEFPNYFVQRGGSVFYLKQNDWRLGYRIRTRYPEKKKTRFEGTGFRLILDPD